MPDTPTKSAAVTCPRFTAHPVRRGDAFELCWANKRILVDGGQYPKDIGHLLTQPTFDAVFCTHGDADHALGLSDLLRERRTKELWVPATWKSVVAHAIELNGKGNLERYLVTLEDKTEPIPQDDEANNGSAFDADLAVEAVSTLPTLCSCGSYWLHSSQTPPQLILSQLAQSPDSDSQTTYLEAYHNIVTIIRVALRAKIPICTLKYEGRVTNVSIPGLPGLSAHNASLGNRIERFPSLLEALTLANQECITLIFSDSEGSVLFCGDSDLTYTDRIDLPEHALVTVPHHGSNHNDEAYDILGTTPRVWIRSDSATITGSRPTTKYLNAPGQRYCVVCRAPTKGLPQPVSFEARAGRWTVATGRSGCTCV